MCKRVFLAAVAALAFTSGAKASVISYFATLSGANESPANASTGTGTAEVDIDTVANTMHVHVIFSGLTSPTTAAHIHSATASPETGTANVAVPFTDFLLSVTSGTYDQTVSLALDSTYSSAFLSANGGTAASAEAALLAGMAADEAYVNIHTLQYPAGEIRGFLVPAPEPASLAFVAGGTLLLFRRRRHC